MNEGFLLAIVLAMSVFGLVVAFFLSKWVLKKDTGTKSMQEISNAIKEGAEAFLRRQYKTITVLASAFAVVLFIGYGILRGHHDFDPVNSSIALAFWITFSFVAGAICSLIAGYIGMWVSIRTNIRTASGTMRSTDEGLRNT